MTMKRLIAGLATLLVAGCGVLTSNPDDYEQAATPIVFTSTRPAAELAKCLERARSEYWATQVRDGVTPGSYEVLSRYDIGITGLIKIDPTPTGSSGTAYWHGLGESTTREALGKCGVTPK